MPFFIHTSIYLLNITLVHNLLFAHNHQFKDTNKINIVHEDTDAILVMLNVGVFTVEARDVWRTFNNFITCDNKNLNGQLKQHGIINVNDN